MSSPSATEPDLRYPIGRANRKASLSPDERRAAIDVIADQPRALREAVSGLSDAQLDTPYRPGGWTVRQLVHHVADSHMNAYLRFRFALTEENFTVKPYAEAVWAELADARTMPPEVSLSLLDAMHQRWVTLMRATPAEAFARELTHPENGPMTLDAVVGTYAWHGRHHTAHVTGLRNRMAWS